MADYLQASSLKAMVAEKLDVFLDVVVHKSVDSTNSWCLRQSKSGKVLPFACFAEQQTSGRGRRGKQWHMLAYNNIAMSLAWPFVLSKQSLNLLPLSIALAIVETLEDIGLKQVQVKWPNDVYVRGEKIAGILIETQAVMSRKDGISQRAMDGGAIISRDGVYAENCLEQFQRISRDGRYFARSRDGGAIKHGQVSESVADEKSTNGKLGNDEHSSEKPSSDKHWAVVIGLGLNYQMLKSNHMSDQTRSDQIQENELLVLTDICQQLESQKIAAKPTRNSVAAALLCNVITACRNFSQVSTENLEKFRASYDFCKQKEVKIILDNNEVLTGVAQGVNENAELLVLVAGELRVFNSADVSVRADMSRDGLYAENCQEQFQRMSRDGRPCSPMSTLWGAKSQEGGAT